MAITVAQPVPNTKKVTPDADLNLTLTEDWVIKTDNVIADLPTFNPAFFIGDPLFPAVGSVHPANSAFRFRTFQNAAQEAHNLWKFSGMTYSTKQRDLANDFKQDRFDDTLVADREWSHTVVSRFVDRAYVADPTGVNKFVRPVPAGDFSATTEPVGTTIIAEPLGGLDAPRYLPVCTYTRNELAPPAALVTGGLVGAVNTDTITIDGLTVAPQTCMIQDLTVSAVKRSLQASTGNQIAFRTVRYQLAINDEGWDIDVLNAGFYAIYDAIGASGFTKVIERIKVADGVDEDGARKIFRPVSTPVPLDINAEWIDTDPQSPDYDPNWKTDKVHWRVFRVRRYVPFAGFAFS